ncbi:MAG: RagB/SusD family nutrient uptake outer membrane protein, partial [Bacteroidales bacterium]|nr:RagB/SusD family nutrient uptake outer membrane protein [Bacteroidales bacterium]
MKKIKFLLVIAIIAGVVLLDACKESFLEITPKGSLDESVLATADGVDGLLIGAYSLVDGASDGFGWSAATSGWVFGSIRGLEANKGTDSGDQPDINPLQTYSETATNPYLNTKWRAVYEGISRCNSTIVTANAAEEAETISADEATSFIRQARALRGFFHFEAWRLWADRTSNTFVPYVDENTDQSTLVNTEDIRSNIIEDLTEGTLLPN